MTNIYCSKVVEKSSDFFELFSQQVGGTPPQAEKGGFRGHSKIYMSTDVCQLTWCSVKLPQTRKAMGAYGSTCALGTTVRQDGYDAQVSCIQVQILWSSASKSKGAKHFLLVA